MERLNKDFKKLDKIFATDAPHARYSFINLIGQANYQFVHPVKQRKVYTLTQALLEEDEEDLITDIIVFGSSVTLFCNSYSDLDMAVLGDFEDFTTKVPLYKYGQVDLFGYNKEDFLKKAKKNRFYREILNKGVKVYEQLPTPC